MKQVTKQNLETIQRNYVIAKNRTGPIKKFTAMGREHLQLDWFSAVGISMNYKMNIYKFIDAFLYEEDSPYFIETIIVKDLDSKVGNFATAVDEEFKNLKPEVDTKTKPKVVVNIKTKPHKSFKEVLMLCELERQVFLSGPAGTGKTKLASHVAESMGLEFGHISCTAGMSEAKLLGRMNAHGEYISSLFVRLYEEGGVFLFDEVDAADGNTMLVINSALANNHMSVPDRKGNQIAHRHEDFICLCAANTWGFGSSQYVGRNILDAAFLDRFVGSKVFVDYDTRLERELGAGNEKLLEVMWKIRKNVKDHRLQRIVSTRAIISGVRQVNYGITLKDYVDRFFVGWTAEEIVKAMAGINIDAVEVNNIDNNSNTEEDEF